MREAHAHVAAYGQSLVMPHLQGCASVEECLDVVRRQAAIASTEGRPSAWVRVHGARVESWAVPRWPTLAELDAAAGARPCVVMSFDHHAAAANSAAMKAAGLKPGQAVPPSGLVEVDQRTGAPTGHLVEHAAYRAWESAPEPTAEERREHVRSALAALASLGFRSVHDLHSQDWLGPTLAELERAGRLPVESVRLYPPIKRLEAVHAGRAGWESARVRLAGGKVFADGTLNSRTALMLSPYREGLEGSPLGRAMVTPRDLDGAIRLCESLGLHLAAHAIGDGAVRMVLDALERSATTREPGGRHRIEHAEIIDEADIPRFASVAGGVVCSVQPCHLLADVEVLTRQLPHRLGRVMPLRDLIDAGCTPGGGGGSGGGEDGSLLWFGSDVPIVRPEPTDSVQAATERRRFGRPRSEAIAWAQRVTVAEARAAFGSSASGGAPG